MTLDKETRSLVDNVKRKIKTEVKFLDNLINKGKVKSAKFGPHFSNNVLKECYFVGSLFPNIFVDGKNRSESDIDIIVKNNTDTMNNIINYASIDKLQYEVQVFDESVEKYSSPITGVAVSVKMTFGKLQKINLNILAIDCKGPLDASLHTAKFDFEICNWFYDYAQDELYVSHRAIELLKKKELEYSDEYFAYLTKEFDLNRNSYFLVDEPMERLISDLQIRLQNYVNLKGYVLTQKMTDFITKLNDKVNAEIWKI